MYEKVLGQLKDILGDLDTCVDDLDETIENDTRIDFDIEDFKWELEKDNLLSEELERFIDNYMRKHKE